MWGLIGGEKERRRGEGERRGGLWDGGEVGGEEEEKQRRGEKGKEEGKEEKRRGDCIGL